MRKFNTTAFLGPRWVVLGHPAKQEAWSVKRSGGPAKNEPDDQKRKHRSPGKRISVFLTPDLCALFSIYSSWMIFWMDLGIGGGLSSRHFANWLVILTMNESARLSSKVIPAIWPSMLDLKPFKTRGFSRILISSLMVLLARSEADRIFLMVLYRLDPLGIFTPLENQTQF